MAKKTESIAVLWKNVVVLAFYENLRKYSCSVKTLGHTVFSMDNLRTDSFLQKPKDLHSFLKLF